MKGTAWQKSLEGKEILNMEDYNTIVKLTIEFHLFQEGSLQDKIDDQILGPETEETKAKIIEKCMLLFSNVTKAHEINLAVAMDLKELSTLIKEPEVFSRIVQAHTTLLIVFKRSHFSAPVSIETYSIANHYELLIHSQLPKHLRILVF